MDRQIVYPGGIPLDTDILNVERSTMVALGYLAQAALGTNVVADGLACVPTSPASMSVIVGAGSVTQLGVVDTMAFGSLGADATDPLLKMGINTAGTNFALTAPSVPGQAVDYLVQASLIESDATPIVLPYYNASNPAQPYSGPGNDGIAQNTQRLQRVQIEVKQGIAAASGSQTPPPVDAGWVGLYVVTVAYGQSTVTGENIARLAAAPFVNWKLPELTPGYRNMAVFSPGNQGLWTVPAGITVLKLRLWGGGGAGGAGFGGAGGGGAGGGACEGYCAVAPGETFQVTVGNGGVGSGTPGGTSSFGSVASATGGQAGGGGSPNAGGAGAGVAGLGVGLGILASGTGGGTPFLASTQWVSGAGGSAHGAAGGMSVVAAANGAATGQNGATPGGGGAGGVGGGTGGQGGAGLVVVEW